MTRIGVLAIQGDVYENVSALRDAAAELGCDVEILEVKTQGQMESIDGLLIPGGESTTIGRLCVTNDSIQYMRQRIQSGMPVLGICAGMVLLAGEIRDKTRGQVKQPSLEVLDVGLERNSFGRQKESFEVDISLEPIGIDRYRGIFIRAPVVTRVAEGVEVLARVGESVVAVKKGNIIGTSFHPEIGGDVSVHKYFVSLVCGLG